MGHLVNPIAMRLNVNRNFISKWVAYNNVNFKYLILQDISLEQYVDWLVYSSMFGAGLNVGGFFITNYQIFRGIASTKLVFYMQHAFVVGEELTPNENNFLREVSFKATWYYLKLRLQNFILLSKFKGIKKRLYFLFFLKRIFRFLAFRKITHAAKIAKKKKLVKVWARIGYSKKRMWKYKFVRPKVWYKIFRNRFERRKHREVNPERASIREFYRENAKEENPYKKKKNQNRFWYQLRQQKKQKKQQEEEVVKSLTNQQSFCRLSTNTPPKVNKIHSPKLVKERIKSNNLDVKKKLTAANKRKIEKQPNLLSRNKGLLKKVLETTKKRKLHQLKTGIKTRPTANPARNAEANKKLRQGTARVFQRYRKLTCSWWCYHDFEVSKVKKKKLSKKQRQRLKRSRQNLRKLLTLFLPETFFQIKQYLVARKNQVKEKKTWGPKDMLRDLLANYKKQQSVNKLIIMKNYLALRSQILRTTTKKKYIIKKNLAVSQLPNLSRAVSESLARKQHHVHYKRPRRIQKQEQEEEPSMKKKIPPIRKFKRILKRLYRSSIFCKRETLKAYRGAKVYKYCRKLFFLKTVSDNFTWEKRITNFKKADFLLYRHICNKIFVYLFEQFFTVDPMVIKNKVFFYKRISKAKHFVKLKVYKYELFKKYFRKYIGTNRTKYPSKRTFNRYRNAKIREAIRLEGVKYYGFLNLKKWDIIREARKTRSIYMASFANQHILRKYRVLAYQVASRLAKLFLLLFARKQQDGQIAHIKSMIPPRICFRFLQVLKLRGLTYLDFIHKTPKYLANVAKIQRARKWWNSPTNSIQCMGHAFRQLTQSSLADCRGFITRFLPLQFPLLYPDRLRIQKSMFYLLADKIYEKHYFKENETLTPPAAETTPVAKGFLRIAFPMFIKYFKQLQGIRIFEALTDFLKFAKAGFFYAFGTQKKHNCIGRTGSSRILVHYHLTSNRESITPYMLCQFIKKKIDQRFSIKRTILLTSRILRGMMAIKGFKIAVSGRFSRKSRASVFIRKMGKQGMSTVMMPLDYYQDVIQGRYGVCGLKVWLVRRGDFVATRGTLEPGHRFLTYKTEFQHFLYFLTLNTLYFNHRFLASTEKRAKIFTLLKTAKHKTTLQAKLQGFLQRQPVVLPLRKVRRLFFQYTSKNPKLFQPFYLPLFLYQSFHFYRYYLKKKRKLKFKKYRDKYNFLKRYYKRIVFPFERDQAVTLLNSVVNFYNQDIFLLKLRRLRYFFIAKKKCIRHKLMDLFISGTTDSHFTKVFYTFAKSARVNFFSKTLVLEGAAVFQNYVSQFLQKTEPLTNYQLSVLQGVFVNDWRKYILQQTVFKYMFDSYYSRNIVSSLLKMSRIGFKKYSLTTNVFFYKELLLNKTLSNFYINSQFVEEEGKKDNMDLHLFDLKFLNFIQHKLISQKSCDGSTSKDKHKIFSAQYQYLNSFFSTLLPFLFFTLGKLGYNTDVFEAFSRFYIKTINGSSLILNLKEPGQKMAYQLNIEPNITMFQIFLNYNQVFNRFEAVDRKKFFKIFFTTSTQRLEKPLLTKLDVSKRSLGLLVQRYRQLKLQKYKKNIHKLNDLTRSVSNTNQMQSFRKKKKS